MSEFRKLIEESVENVELEEGIGSVVRNGLLGATMALGAMQSADAKTDPEMLRSGAHSVTAKYEHGGKGYSAIVKDNYGGYSYGKEQLSTRRLNSKNANSTFDAFMKYAGKKAPYIKKALETAGGWQGAFRGTDTFKQAWLKLANQKEFQDVYDDFILDTQVLPVFNRMDQATSVNLDKITRWGSQNSAMQAAIRSAIIQHGRDGAFKMICNVVKAHNPANMGEFIRDLYKYRAKKFPKYKSRYTNECDDVIEYLKSKDSNIDMAYGHKPGQSGYELDQLINQISKNPVTPEKVSVSSTPTKASVAKKK
ncbi:MAG: hypothetical protein J6W64_08775 [Bacilli bacterium]|nr:hypothetical protein [Bacilli bacterium]